MGLAVTMLKKRGKRGEGGEEAGGATDKRRERQWSKVLLFGSVLSNYRPILNLPFMS